MKVIIYPDRPNDTYEYHPIRIHTTNGMVDGIYDTGIGVWYRKEYFKIVEDDNTWTREISIPKE